MKVTHYLPLAAACLMMVGCGTGKQKAEMTAGIQLANLDTTALPGSSFYQYACGGWIESHPLSPEYSQYGSFTELAENNRKQIQGLIEELAATQHEAGSVAQKVGDLYKIVMDSVKLNKEGVAPIKADLEQIASLKDKEAVYALLADLRKQGIGAYLGLYVAADEMNSNENAVQLYQSGLSMGERDYYLATDPSTTAIRDAFRTHVQKMYQLAGFDEATAKKGMEVVMDVETRLAKAFRSRTELRDPHANYNKMSMEEVKKNYPTFNWDAYLSGLGLTDVKEIIVGQPASVAEAANILNTLPVDQQVLYLQWKLIDSAASALNDEMAQQNFDFYERTMSGTQEMQPRWKTAVSVVSSALGEAVGQMYVEKYFPAAAKERMIELNKTINWKPESTGTGRFGKWLENLNDWNLSRSRYWGTPLPIWRSEEGEELCIGSVEELYNEIEKSIAAGFMTANPYKEKGFIPGEYTEDNYDKIDLHRPYVDDIILVSESGKPMKREADLIDVWFDSGAMPYAQLHYPFENKDIVDNRSYYPADFIAEGVDQTRGWFFTLHAIATMVFDSVAYKNVISNGLVLDKNGNKMSKRLGNAVDPFGAIEQYGSDPLRWYMITNSSPWDNLKFDTDGVMEVTRKFFGTLHNTYKFFAPYANLDGFTYQEADVPMSKRPEIDRWILSELNSLIKNVDMCYADYEPTKAGRLINDFVNDNLSNWYVRLCRKRFWGTGYTEDKLAAYQTLYVCLETVAKLMAPIAPFYADKLYMDLIATTGRDHVASVHLADFPVCDETVIDKELETRMELAQKVSSMGLALRKKINIIVKQPLQKLMIPVDALMKERLESVKSLIMNEVNVKEIDFVEGTSNLLVKKVKCNFKILGKKFGSLMKQVAAAVTAMNQEQISVLENEGKIVLDLNGTPAEIETSEVEIFSEDIPGWVVANEGVLTVALDTVVTEELRREGIARELVSKIQNIRKGSGFEITDKIKVSLSKNEQTDSAVKEYNTYICNQVLANSLNLVDEVKDGIELSFDDFSLYVSVVKE